MNSNPSSVRVSVFGLGYVGSVTAACLASRGFDVTGVDVHPRKVDLLNEGKAPISEPGLDDLIREQRDAGRLRATNSAEEAVAGSEVSIVCVGTPSLPSGALDLSYVEHVSAEIHEATGKKRQGHALIFRSTMLPGSTRKLAEKFPLSGGSVYFYPEFLRQGTALQDFQEPSLAVLGASSAGSDLPGSVRTIVGESTEVVAFEEAELLKYACNAFHATKVSFANEIGRIGKALGLDSRVVMRLLCDDTRLNISPYYMRPGTPFGGSCLPKDVSALKIFSHSLDVSAPTLGSVLDSNKHHLSLLGELVESREAESVLLLGLAFKPDTDDLRGSAMLELAASLLMSGYQVRIFDPLVQPKHLIGANERFAHLKLPDLADLLERDLENAISSAQTIVVSKKCAPLEDVARYLNGDHHIIDVNGWPELAGLDASYEGLCW